MREQDLVNGDAHDGHVRRSWATRASRFLIGVVTCFATQDGIPATECAQLLLPSARLFASHEMKRTTELAVGVSSAGFEFDCGYRRYLL